MQRNKTSCQPSFQILFFSRAMWSFPLNNMKDNVKIDPGKFAERYKSLYTVVVERPMFFFRILTCLKGPHTNGAERSKLFTLKTEGTWALQKGTSKKIVEWDAGGLDFEKSSTGGRSDLRGIAFYSRGRKFLGHIGPTYFYNCTPEILSTSNFC